MRLTTSVSVNGSGSGSGGSGSGSGRTLPLALALTLVGCASVGRPPGGPIDTDPPEVVAASIDTNAVGVKASKLEIRFNEVIAERPAVSGGPGSPVTLEAIVLVSPRTGMPKVDWSREAITIEPRGGFLPNTTYRVTLLPGLADIRGNVSKSARSWVFSTGPQILPFGILGRVFDWQAGVIAPGAVVEAVANVGTPDSSVYVAATDSLGQFELGPLGAGRYLVRTYIDADRNRDRGVLEKWDSATVTVTDHRPSIELLAAQRDSAPVGIQSAVALDSVWVRIDLDKPFNPRVQLAPSMVAVLRADSSVIQVEALMTEERALVLRQPADTGARPVAAPPPVTGLPSTRPPVATPSLPRPVNVIYARVNPLTPLKTGERYSITVRALPNLQGRAGSSPAVFDGPRVPTRPPVPVPSRDEG
jgi:hypothetical protein